MTDSIKYRGYEIIFGNHTGWTWAWRAPDGEGPAGFKDSLEEVKNHIDQRIADASCGNQFELGELAERLRAW